MDFFNAFNDIIFFNLCWVLQIERPEKMMKTFTEIMSHAV